MTYLLIFTFLLAATALCEGVSGWEQVFQRANEAHTQGRYESAERLYRAALARFRETGATTAHLPMLLNNLAAECQILKQFDEAQSLYREAIAEWRKYPAPHNGVSRSLSNLAGLYRMMSSYEESAAAYVEALSEIERGVGTATLEYASTLSKASDLQRSLGNLEDALPMAERAARIASEFFRRPGPPSECQEADPTRCAGESFGIGDPVMVRILQVLARVYADIGRLDDAEKTYENTYTTVVKADRAASEDAAAALTGLGNIASRRGEFAKAELMYREAAAIYQQVLGVRHPLHAVGLNNLAQAIRHQGRGTEAEPLYLRALQILESGPAAASIELAACLANFGEFHHARGKEGQAAVYLARSLSILQSKLREDHRDVALARLRLAEVKGAQRSYVDAVRLYRLALPSLTKSFGAADPRVAASTLAYKQLLKEAGSYVVMVR